MALTRISRLPVCEDCLAGMVPIAGRVCSSCGDRIYSAYAFSGAEGEVLCTLCNRVAPPFVCAVAYGSYEGGLRELIHLLKYNGVRPAANVLGRMLAEAIAVLEADFGDDPVLVVPVPLHRSKHRQRGFNQAEAIARIALKQLAASERLHLDEEGLLRQRETVSQTGLTSHQRRANVRGAFEVARREAVKNRKVLLVDDIYTTGATVSECARVLRRAGASKVWVATVARTLKASTQFAQLDRVSDAPDAEESSLEVPMAKAAGS